METDFTAYVAIDWADQRHAWMLQATGSATREAGNTGHAPEVDFRSPLSMSYQGYVEGRAERVAS